MAAKKQHRTPRDLARLVAQYQICADCRIIDRDHHRRQYGYLCPVCGKPGQGGHSYFEISVHVLTSLVEESADARRPRSNSTRFVSVNVPHIAAVLFFCTLRELLLNWLIEYLCGAQKIPKPIYERLLADNNGHARRQNAVLPSLTGRKWKALVAHETKASGVDYGALNDFLERAVAARNKFMHEGKHWGIDRALARDCASSVPALLEFYVALHNRYVHPVHLKAIGP